MNEREIAILGLLWLGTWGFYTFGCWVTRRAMRKPPPRLPRDEDIQRTLVRRKWF